MRNAFTVDLEDWYQGLTSTNPLVSRWPEFESRIVTSTQRLLSILQEQRVCATFFVLGYVADHYPHLIEEICAQGHEIGVHGYYHRFVYQMSETEFGVELERSIEAVTRITGEAPIGHRAPYFSINQSTPWAFTRMETAGIRYDSSVFPTRNMLYGYPGAPRFPYRVEGHNLHEYPASTVRIGGMTLPIAGGFYVRFLPDFVTRWAIGRINRLGQPAILYVHPWELDVEQNYWQVTPRERLTHYYGRRTLEAKLHRILAAFEFTTVQNLLCELPN